MALSLKAATFGDTGNAFESFDVLETALRQYEKKTMFVNYCKRDSSTVEIA